MGDWGREVQEERVGAPALGSSPELEALLAHARALVGVELGELADQLGLPEPVGAEAARRSKGWSGQVIERELGVETGGGAGPDFVALGTELKTVPVDERLTPRESTAVCQIDPVTIAGESWETSTARKKLARVLFVALEVPPGTRSVGQRRVAAVRLWSPSTSEEALLRSDFELFARDYFRRGRSSAITGHLGQVLQVRPKGRNAADLRDGYDEHGQPTRVGKCGFYLRAPFVAAVLRGA